MNFLGNQHGSASRGNAKQIDQLKLFSIVPPPSDSAVSRLPGVTPVRMQRETKVLQLLQLEHAKMLQRRNPVEAKLLKPWVGSPWQVREDDELPHYFLYTYRHIFRPLC